MHKYVIYCPEKFVPEVTATAINLTGGATLSPGHTGYWKDGGGDLHVDQITLVTVFAEGDIALRNIVATLLDGGEMSVAYEVDGVPHLTEEVTA